MQERIGIGRSAHLLVAVAAVLAAGACGSSTSVGTAPTPIARCGVTLGAPDSTIPADGGTGRIVVTTARECAWTASTDANWLTINGFSSGQGDGAVEFRAVANPDPVVRRGGVVLNGQRAEVAQAAGACVFQLREPSATLPQTGGTGTVNLTASSQLCSWTATADADWITLTSAANGQGTAAIRFQVGATNGPPRTGTIIVAGQRFSVTQSEGCAYSITPSSHAADTAGGQGTITVTTSQGCPWTAGSNVDWLTVTGPTSGSGPGAVAFSVAPGSGPPRTGTMTVAGQTFTVTQGSGCVYQIDPAAHTVDAAGGARSVTVSAPPGCSWTASSNVPWITVTAGSSGAGGGTVTFTVAPLTGSARAGTLTIAGQTVTVSQAQGCSYAVAPEAVSLPADGWSGTVSVTAGAGCPWTAATTADWISITEGAIGSGNGTVRFTAASSGGPSRTATLTIAGRSVTVTQGQGCTFALSPEQTSVPASGGSRTFDVQTAGGCSWSASANVPWISIQAGASGSGGGAVRISVAANTGGARTGTVTVGGRVFTVEQAGTCAYTLSSASFAAPVGGGSGSVGVTTTGSCGWTAVSNASWLAITSGGSGTGSGTVTFTAAQNTGPARSGTLTIAGQTFTVSQSSACSYSIAPQQQSADFAGGSVTVTVSAPAGCSWSAASNASWITVSSGASGSGNGTVQLVVGPNSGSARTGSVTIAGQTFTISQAEQPPTCSYGVAPSTRSAGAEGGTASFTVNTASACSWTAVSEVPWIVITGGASGTGNGRVEYAVQPNTGPQRTGTISVEGTIFTVVQGGR